MILRGVHHVNIGCRPKDLGPIEQFYGRVLGLTVGERPEFPNAGLWLYMGKHPLIHVVVRFPDDWPGSNEKLSSWDHVAFDVEGADEYRRRLLDYGAHFDEQNVPDAGFQMFVRDPVGNKIELNFPNSEAPARVAPGTLSGIQFPHLAKKSLEKI
jgi:catechol 2,3-dioxygenase-like lactoylglutathione lyase family enzyme